LVEAALAVPTSLMASALAALATVWAAAEARLRLRAPKQIRLLLQPLLLPLRLPLRLRTMVTTSAARAVRVVLTVLGMLVATGGLLASAAMSILLSILPRLLLPLLRWKELWSRMGAEAADMEV
jgi:hypothetical protein